MKIYFTASVSQMTEYGNHYKKIVDQLTRKGYQVQSDHIIKANLKDILVRSDVDTVHYYKQFLKWLNAADIMVAEASFPSTVNIGHEISIALEKGKPVIVMYHKGKNPVFLHGIKEQDRLMLAEYDESNIEEVVSDVIEDAKENMDVRFNFFVSPTIVTYLDWIAKKRRMPRAVYLRRLIESDMEKNRDYSNV